VQLRYRHEPHVQFESKPYVFAGRDESELEDNPMDIVNAKRQELELQTGLTWCINLFEKSTDMQAFLFDGSLIFWHLASYSTYVKDYYMGRYLGLMHELYAQQILHGGYISLPKSKELVNLIRVELCNFVIEGCTDHKVVDHIVDTTVAGFFLQPGQRTTVFRSNALICKQYPTQLVPHFFYLHVGNEIARVEVPAWIAQDEQKVQSLACIMYDQAAKGHGYPVALAEAHEQAVVKGPDRDFFYHMVHKLAVEHKKQQHISQKSTKKRIIGI
jgi:NurA domain